MIESGGRWLPNCRILFFVGLIVCASGVVSPPVALLAGVAFGMTVTHPFASENGALAKLLLQCSVVALGFGMNLQQVVHAGRSGFAYTAVSIGATLALGWVLGRVLGVEKTAAFLITAGTAICGGSAIAALAPILEANEEEMSVSMGTVFVLNSVALLVFPVLGAAMHMTQHQFGLWAALAIHDTSSVVGAAAKYGAQALTIGTTVKLARALWIVPLALVTAGVVRRAAPAEGTGQRAKVKMPWFILYFCLASVAATYLPGFGGVWGALNHLGRVSLIATLFVIGTGISRRTLREVGPRPLVQGVVLWLVAGSVSAWVIYRGWIGI